MTLEQGTIESMGNRYQNRRREAGFSLISAIFLLVVLAALGAAIANISSMQHTSSALDVQGARAYQAARAGIEWGVYQQLRGPGCSGTQSFVPPAPTLSGFTVTVVCAAPATYVNATPPITVYQIQSTACNQPDAAGNCPGAGGGAFYIERQLQVTLSS